MPHTPPSSAWLDGFDTKCGPEVKVSSVELAEMVPPAGLVAKADSGTAIT